jgi:hypothetical protein
LAKSSIGSEMLYVRPGGLLLDQATVASNGLG